MRRLMSNRPETGRNAEDDKNVEAKAEAPVRKTKSDTVKCRGFHGSDHQGRGSKTSKTRPAKPIRPESRPAEPRPPKNPPSPSRRSPIRLRPRCTRREEGYGASARRGNVAKAEPPRRHRPDRGVREPQGFQAVRPRELQAAVRRSDHHRAERPAAGYARLHRRGRQERSQPVALVGGLAAGHGPQCGPDRRGRPRWHGAARWPAPAEAKPLPAPNSPAEALDRITLAPEAMARIAEVLTTGSSIVVSDHGINQGGETGEGTDFIVPLR